MAKKSMNISSILCPARDELLAFLADIDSDALKNTRDHVASCKSCRDHCYFLDPVLDHDD